MFSYLRRAIGDVVSFSLNYSLVIHCLVILYAASVIYIIASFCFCFHDNLRDKEALLIIECCNVSYAVILTDLKDWTNTL